MWRILRFDRSHSSFGTFLYTKIEFEGLQAFTFNAIIDITRCLCTGSYVAVLVCSFSLVFYLF